MPVGISVYNYSSFSLLYLYGMCLWNHSCFWWLRFSPWSEEVFIFIVSSLSHSVNLQFDLNWGHPQVATYCHYLVSRNVQKMCKNTVGCFDHSGVPGFSSASLPHFPDNYYFLQALNTTSNVPQALWCLNHIMSMHLISFCTFLANHWLNLPIQPLRCVENVNPGQEVFLFLLRFFHLLGIFHFQSSHVEIFNHWSRSQ